jgi:hypothetical protein
LIIFNIFYIAHTRIIRILVKNVNCILVTFYSQKMIIICWIGLNWVQRRKKKQQVPFHKHLILQKYSLAAIFNILSFYYFSTRLHVLLSTYFEYLYIQWNAVQLFLTLKWFFSLLPHRITIPRFLFSSAWEFFPSIFTSTHWLFQFGLIIKCFCLDLDFIFIDISN